MNKNKNNNIKINCIKKLCPMYFSSDIFETCSLVPDKCITKECIGYDEIQPEIEKIMDKVSVLMTEYGRLDNLKEYISDYQDQENER